ncbi:Rho termination factor N-terminal domain-containing protein [Bacillus subtilis]|uniref:Rho termination factor N-terminal domain-containing protein n=1 Tax=Bacillus phage vB_BsuS_PJN02 TaxID=2920374 RepID=A0AC61TSJ9_9CAUD|nr:MULTISPECIES: Rho termination factor N-terminal domain-containing protein [Bacillus subtilis group]YP_010681847.1 Rho termination factor N-terminal domain-containing protein [Bacillus phage vB_BsuS_PJN02]MCR4362149.1 Rho termination factor N-terminal domain-containing protein [Bacillus subtilis]UNH58572.1 Rho termination factor N-terminal domain-containing protein [Bacillus phage vB_BsuS_PJN02]UQB84250.1 Rho termination factor N-terminal domain-containing protein [Bacillus amyloliquefaciens]
MKLTEMTAKELYKLAQEKEIPNRSKMRKEDLLKALSKFVKVDQSEKAKEFIQKKKKKNSAYSFLNLKRNKLSF